MYKSKKLLKNHREHIDSKVRQNVKVAKEIPSVIEEDLEELKSKDSVVSSNNDSIEDFFIENLSDDESAESTKKKRVKVPTGSIIVADDQLVNI